jgi:hypothetical protein
VAPASKKLSKVPITVTTIAGTTTSASTFSYEGCKVPKLGGKKLKGAKKSLRGADCKIGTVKKINGATSKTGKVRQAEAEGGQGTGARVQGEGHSQAVGASQGDAAALRIEVKELGATSCLMKSAPADGGGKPPVHWPGSRCSVPGGDSSVAMLKNHPQVARGSLHRPRFVNDLLILDRSRSSDRDHGMFCRVGLDLAQPSLPASASLPSGDHEVPSHPANLFAGLGPRLDPLPHAGGSRTQLPLRGSSPF